MAVVVPLLITLLKLHWPTVYGDRARGERARPEGGSIRTESGTDLTKLSDEQLKQLTAILRDAQEE